MADITQVNNSQPRTCSAVPLPRSSFQSRPCVGGARGQRVHQSPAAPRWHAHVVGQRENRCINAELARSCRAHASECARQHALPTHVHAHVVIDSIREHTGACMGSGRKGGKRRSLCLAFHEGHAPEASEGTGDRLIWVACSFSLLRMRWLHASPCKRTCHMGDIVYVDILHNPVSKQLGHPAREQ